jgi:hypothetical protein
MTEPESCWPCKKSFSPAPEEEFRKDMLQGVCNVVKELQQSPEGEDNFPVAGKGGLERLVRVFGLVMAAVYQWRKKKGAVEPVIINSNGKGQRWLGYPSLECQRAAELYLLERAQKGMNVSGARMLATDVATEEDFNGRRRKLIVVSSRGRIQIEDMYRQTELPLLAREHPLSRL